MTLRQRRNSLRLEGYDYSDPGDYFVTICTFQRGLWLSRIKDGEVRLSDQGKVVQMCWRLLPNHYPHIRLGVFVLMPNHLHGIVSLALRVDDTPRHDLSEMMRWFKGISTKHLNRARGRVGQRVWQRGFYDVIVQDPDHYDNTHYYIVNNPYHWESDRLHPSHPNPYPMDDE